MNIDTTRFGKIEINETDLITMEGAILGFEHLKRFVLLIHDGKTPLGWLQSLDDPSIAFVVINPRIVKPDYNPTIFEDYLKFLDIQSEDDIALLSIVTVRSNPFRVTANLKAPLLINAANSVAAQTVIDDDHDYPIQYDILDHKADLNTIFPGDCKKMRGLGKISLALTTI